MTRTETRNMAALPSFPTDLDPEVHRVDETGLFVVQAVSSWYDEDPTWMVPQGYHFFDQDVEDYDRSQYARDEYPVRVRFGTLGQIAAMAGCTFIPAA